MNTKQVIVNSFVSVTVDVPNELNTVEEQEEWLDNNPAALEDAYNNSTSELLKNFSIGE